MLLWGDLDQDQWSKITQIMAHQKNPVIRDQNGVIGSVDVPYSEWSWITDPVPERPKRKHEMYHRQMNPKSD